MQSIRVGFYSQDKTLYTLLSSALNTEFQFYFVPDQTAITRLLASDTCHVIVADLSSTDSQWRDHLHETEQLMSEGITCVLLADPDLRSEATALVRRGAYGYCHRPPSMRDLTTMLRRAHESVVLRQQLQPSGVLQPATLDFDGMVGTGPQMQQLYQQVRCVASIEASVLITGESGTGKELVARAIHNTGSRGTRPFVAVSCGAIPETLIEAELFGHEKGAFTGSTGSREGYFEQASDGTLLLDEIGDLSLYTQVKLLRVLQQREFSRLGSTKLIPLRARLIFATHQDLSEQVAQGKFRQDLYYRINVMGIEVPTLQERPEDIPLIAAHFLQRYSQIFDKRIESIGPKALALLQRHPWPGNIRELENVIQRAIIVAQGDTLEVADLPSHLQEQLVISIDDALPAGSFERQLRDYKVKLATAAVREQNGNKTMAARSLRISRAYLHRLIRLGTNPSLELVEEDNFPGFESPYSGFGGSAAV